MEFSDETHDDLPVESESRIFVVILVPTLQRGNAILGRSSVPDTTENNVFSHFSDAGASGRCVPTLERGNECVFT
jgi:hypothetical protein